MSDYLDRIGSGFILLNPDPLDFDYIPEVMVGRETIQETLAAKFHSIAHPNGSANVVITGPVGSGKTLLARTFCRDIEYHLRNKRPLRSVHINCRNATTNVRVAQRIVQSLDPGHPDRGLSMGELLSSLRKMLKSNGRHLIVVLDEVDHLLRKSGNDLIYQLLRIDEDQEGSGTLSLILISQEQVLDVLENAVISRFGHTNHIPVPPYDMKGLLAIARQRAEQALNPRSWDEEILKLIATSAAPSGDARQVIELLGAAVEHAESDGQKNIMPEHVQTKAREVPQVMPEDVLDDLSAHSMLVLLGICRRLRKAEFMTSKDVESIYAVVCEEYEVQPRSHTTVWKFLKQIESMNIIATRVDTVGEGRGRTTHISMPHALPVDVATRIEGRVAKKLKR
ncbi:MAG: AAA family ATPase [Candidatus Thermoplasmatota archaeon]|nr:AAA family ATPase [Candidatus Thermoplasmatota archaeon]